MILVSFSSASFTAIAIFVEDLIDYSSIFSHMRSIFIFVHHQIENTFQTKSSMHFQLQHDVSRCVMFDNYLCKV